MDGWDYRDTPQLPTWQAFVSANDPRMKAGYVARIVANAIGQGATITNAVGVWDGSTELAVAIRIEGERSVLDDALAAIARAFPNVHDVHVERHEPRTEYVNVDHYRATERQTA